MQIALRLEGLVGGAEIIPVAAARERRRDEARVFRGREIEVAEVSDRTIPGPGRGDPGAPLPPGRRAESARSSSTTTAAAT